MTQNRPQAGACAHYYEKYLALAPEGKIVETPEVQLTEMKQRGRAGA